MSSKQNTLLVPKWKERTHNTHKQHLKLYEGKKFKVAFLGDSMDVHGTRYHGAS